MRVKFEWCQAGCCRHPEFMTIQGGKLSPYTFWSSFGRIHHPDGGWILYDTGYSEHFAEATKHFPEKLYALVTPVDLAPEDTAAAQFKAHGVNPEDVKLIIISHFHGDHVAGLKDFPNAKFITLQEGVDDILKSGKIKNVRRGLLRDLLPGDFAKRFESAESKKTVTLPAELRPFERGYDLLGDGSMLGIPLPGHSAGQLGLAFRTENDRHVFLVADSVWHSRSFREIRYPSSVIKILSFNHAEYKKTITDLHKLWMNNKEILIVPTHCTEISPGIY